ncbi:hypothetical protein LTR56_023074 [Elasticomyces elasticus]|nr:hypothetical protein LTR56_023074 [Elasticomyces elasticus]KAK3639643.1 hypothetical protein LTR22_017316 [Elasticomyces elasticus]KAK4913421.1 hypothetical protein LTR49_018217 [Elasticomyces elasticus]KAK5761008.1 hypothetical protein LTS12_008856 [Elasticomyces elasticus]
MSSRVIFLVGAPLAEDLGADLLTSFNTPVKRFLGHPSAPKATPTQLTQVQASAKWRAISMKNPAHDANVLDQDDVESIIRNHNDEDSTQQHLAFLEHSLALLNKLDSSQILAGGDYDDSTTFSSTFSLATTASESFNNTYCTLDPTELSSTSPAKLGRSSTLQLRGEITDLKRLSSADHINRIQPQTMTINLLATIISVSPPRTITLRKRTGEMDLQELLLGDETRAGFSVTFWHTPTDSQTRQQRDQRDDMRAQLSELRSGDIVLMQNVALSAFKGVVYGQSLSRRFARNSTIVTVVDAGEVGQAGDGFGLPMGIRGKFGRVRKWGDDFVGRTGRTGVGVKRAVGVGRGGDGEVLPPDTQKGEEYG